MATFSEISKDDEYALHYFEQFPEEEKHFTCKERINFQSPTMDSGTHMLEYFFTCFYSEYDCYGTMDFRAVKYKNC